jgi:DNA-binding transcriptional MerR regulator
MRKTNLQFQEQFDSQPQNGTLKIGEVSLCSGIGIEALRFYERSGLLGKPARTASGYRVYDRSVIDRLAFIKKAQTLGFSLDEIRRVIEESQAGESPCAEVREIVRRRLNELDERLREMRRYRKELAATLEEWDEKGSADGDICGLIENSEMKAGQSPAAPVAPKRRQAKKPS